MNFAVCAAVRHPCLRISTIGRMGFITRASYFMSPSTDYLIHTGRTVSIMPETKTMITTGFYYLDIKLALLSVKCPWCNAPAGSPCDMISAANDPYWPHNVHHARERAYATYCDLPERTFYTGRLKI